MDHGLVIRNKQRAPVENLLETAASVMQCDVVLMERGLACTDPSSRKNIARTREHTMTISHQDPIKAVVTHYAGIHIDMFSRFDISNASVTVIRVNDRDASLITLNNVGVLPM
jgi:broad specificity phosphatase PhoE